MATNKLMDLRIKKREKINRRFVMVFTNSEFAKLEKKHELTGQSISNILRLSLIKNNLI